MLELCARGDKRTCGKREGTLGGGVELNLRVLCPNRFTGKDKYASLRWNRSLDWFLFFPSGSAAHAMGWTYKYCTVLNKMLCEATPTFVFVFYIYFSIISGRSRGALSLSLRVEEGKWHQNATTSLRNKLVWLITEKSTCLRTHGSHSDTQSSPQRLIWNDQ